MPRFSISLLAALLVWASSPPGVAAPEWETRSSAGRVYEVQCASVTAERTWIGGMVQDIADPWDPPVWANAFLVCLDQDGHVTWEKEFGSPETGESTRLVALSGSKVYLAGFASCDLEKAWKGTPEVDWSKDFYLARMDQSGQLEKCLYLSARSSSSNIEPFFQADSLLVSPAGELYLGARMRGQLQNIDTTHQEFGAALLLRLDKDLNLLEVTSLEGNSLTCLSLQDGRLLGAGTKDAVSGDEMGPSRQRPVLWDLSHPRSPAVVWQGEVEANTQCLQLGETLLFTNNASDGAIAIDVQSLRASSPLPPAVVTVASAPSTDPRPPCWAGGSRAQEWLEAPSTVCWQREDGIWGQAYVSELKDWEGIRFLTAGPEGLTMIGLVKGPARGEIQWSCRRARSW